MDKLSQQTIDLIKQRERLQHNTYDSEKNKMEYSELDRLTKRTIRKENRAYQSTIAKEILHETKSVKKVRIYLSQRKQWKLGTRNPSGGRTSSREGSISDATSFYKNLYSSKLPNINVRDSRPVEEEAPYIMYSEVRNTIADLRN